MVGLSRHAGATHGALVLTTDVLLALAAGAIGSTPWLPALVPVWTQHRDDRRESVALAWPMALAGTVALTAVLVLSIMHVAARTYNPFIYFDSDERLLVICSSW